MINSSRMRSFMLSGTKEEVFNQIERHLKQIGVRFIRRDDTRPWGGFFVIDENDTRKFIDIFYPELAEELNVTRKMSPKILVVGASMRLSWQYHFRRSEIWKLISGEASIVRSKTDEESVPLPMNLNETVRLQCGERHRLIGTNEWGVVAEIWQHTDEGNPSDENDIVRLQDDFGR